MSVTPPENLDNEPEFYPCDVCGEMTCDAPSSTCLDCQADEGMDGGW